MLHQGKDKPETCSGGNGNQGDGTALSFHKPAHNGEPQAQTTGPRRPEALKNGFRPFGRNARPPWEAKNRHGMPAVMAMDAGEISRLLFGEGCGPSGNAPAGEK